MLKLPLPVPGDPEGDRIPGDVPFVVDAHVHLFPDTLFEAIWSWFDNFAWPIRYRMKSPELIEFLLSRGVGHIVGLHYAHKPGIARKLNGYMAKLCDRYPQLTGSATVFPGEEDARGILKEAFEMGLKAVKLHAHVQFFRMDSEEMREIYEACSDSGKPLVMHVGREPKNPYFPYPVDPYSICAADKLEKVIKDYPRLRVCVPHLGMDEDDAYRRMIEQYDNLWLDTTMVLADYFPLSSPPSLGDMRADRIMYGTDVPNIPYAWDREIKKLCQMGLPTESLDLILAKNARKFFSISG
ncbi:MAG: amidohydrolase [Desulfomonile tiedjei]|nr:amidohydrolase [Desulfomonile tiedjei]